MKNITDKPVVGILGAGIMGCCLALELKKRGHQVDLIDISSQPVTGASLHNEGKLHLGFVYASDPIKQTHKLMLSGSLAFTRILEELCGCQPYQLGPSTEFHYFVPTDSQLDLETIREHFEEVDRIGRELAQDSGQLYLGRKVDRFFEVNPPDVHEKLFSTAATLGSFKTKEMSVSPIAVAEILRKAIINSTGIRFIGNTEVLAVNLISPGNVEVEFRQDDRVTSKLYPCVTNCLWDDKLRIDQSAGIQESKQWYIRYRATLRIEANFTGLNQIPSATGILGKYGDIVNFKNKSYYISWYPLCKLAETRTSAEARLLHDHFNHGPMRVTKKLVDRYPSIASWIAMVAHRGFIKKNLQSTAVYIPAVARLQKFKNSCKLGGGVILAEGSSDIDDPRSMLHQRSAIGPAVYDSYVSVNTGKYCMAPLYALETADLIEGVL